MKCQGIVNGFYAQCILDAGSWLSPVSRAQAVKHHIPTVDWKGPLAAGADGFCRTFDSMSSWSKFSWPYFSFAFPSACCWECNIYAKLGVHSNYYQQKYTHYFDMILVDVAYSNCNADWRGIHLVLLLSRVGKVQVAKVLVLPKCYAVNAVLAVCLVIRCSPAL